MHHVVSAFDNGERLSHAEEHDSGPVAWSTTNKRNQ